MPKIGTVPTLITTTALEKIGEKIVQGLSGANKTSPQRNVLHSYHIIMRMTRRPRYLNEMSRITRYRGKHPVC